MNVTELLERVKRDFGDEYDVIITNIDVYRWVYQGELEIIRESGGNLQTTTAAVNSFPSSIPDNITINRVTIDDRVLLPISKEKLDSVGLHVGSEGSPGYFYTYNREVHLYPSDALDTRTVEIEYNKTPVVITGTPPVPNTFTIPEVWHTDLVNYVMARAHEKRGNLQKAEHFQTMFDKNMGNRNQEADSYDGPIYKELDPMDIDGYYGGW
jgi:hypothetical protein